MKSGFVFTSLLLVFCFVFSLGLVSAGERDPPHQFYGAVLANGVPAPDNVLVVARIDGVDVAATVTRDGYFGLSPSIFYVPDSAEGRAGKTVDFFVKDFSDSFLEAGSAVFVNGMSTRLDISVQGVFSSQTSSGSSGGSSSGSSGSSRGGSGGGSSFIPASNPVPVVDSGADSVVESDEPAAVVDSCSPDWSCSDWLDCLGGVQKRVCVDNNNCGLVAGKPVESRACEPLALKTSLDLEERSSKGFFSLITGNVVGFITNPSASLLLVVLLILVLSAIALFVAKKVKEKSK